MAIILLVVLTFTVCSSDFSGCTLNTHQWGQVDWTIQLIVINSKLSGADSFQATMEHCFGRSGLIAISVRSLPGWGTTSLIFSLGRSMGFVG